MRLFIAISLPKEIKSHLLSLQDKLKAAQAQVSWVKPENNHLTLKFLGQTNQQTAEEVFKIMAETVQDKKSFKAGINSLGAFPNIDYPRTIWAGIGTGKEEIERIARELEEKITQLDIPEESRPFFCHITIGRVKSSLNQLKLSNGLKSLMRSLDQEGLNFNVEKITLFKSTLTATGPVYQALKEASLKAN
jgi:2'-5' RNA ligase